MCARLFYCFSLGEKVSSSSEGLFSLEGAGLGPGRWRGVEVSFGVQRTELEPEVESKGNGEGHGEAILGSE